MKRALLLLAVVALAAGCVSAVTQGQMALRQGRYVEAEGFFNEALAKDPGRTDALVGLGIAQYKEGQTDQAIDSSREGRCRSAPTSPACVSISPSPISSAARRRKPSSSSPPLRALKIDTRVGATRCNRRLDLIKQGPLSDSVRNFIIGKPRDTGGAEPRRARCAAPGADGAGLLLRLLALLSVRALLSLLRLSLSRTTTERSLRTIRALRAREARRSPYCI